METIETLGKYEIKRTLGRGAMGVVYEGWDPTIQRLVAIKTVPIADAGDPETQEALARFRREAQAAGRLTHPNIVSVYDYGETADVAYIVMEYIEGPTLKSLLDKQERFGLPEILRIMQDLLAGLDFSHERGVVHRDIKPANLMLTSADRSKFRAKIADFGIARIESSSMTQAGTMMGTPAYMSPEQFMAETVDSRTDIYSSGVLLYQLLTGERPFEGGMSAIMHKALHTEPPKPSQISVNAPPAFDAVVAKAMAKRPADRFATAGDFAAAVQAAAANPAAVPAADDEAVEATVVAARRPVAPPPPEQPTPAAAPAKSKSSLVPVLAGAAAALLAIGGGGAYLLLRGPEAPRPPSPPTPVVTAPVPAVPREQPAAAAREEPVAPPVAPPPAGPVPDQTAAPVASPAMISDMFAQITATQRCAFIGGAMRGNGEVVLTGIAGAGADQDIRQAAASRAVPGSIQWRVAGADAVFCPALELLQSAAPPFGATEPHLALTLADDRTVLRDGERIRPRVVMPGFVGYLRVDYIAHDGNVQHLYPQIVDASGAVADKVRLFTAGEKVSLGDPPPGQPAWEVGPPYGTDMIIAIASSQPLFTKPRPANVEAAATYLRELDAAVQAVRDGGAKLAVNALLVQALAK
jgi:serine/threonine-protein kinase